MRKLLKTLAALLAALVLLSSCGGEAVVEDEAENGGLVATQFHAEILEYIDTDEGLVLRINDVYNGNERQVIIKKGAQLYSSNDPIGKIIENRDIGALVFIHSEHPVDQSIDSPYPVTAISVFEDKDMQWKDYKSQTLNMLEASKYYRALGRTTMLDTSLTCDWTAAGAEFKLLCKGNIFIGITAANSTTTFTVEVDDSTQKYFLVNKGSGQYTIASGLEPGYHTIKILGEKGYGNNATIDSITFTGELAYVSQKDVYIEVVGDSITCGAGLGNLNGQLVNDGVAAYAYVALDELDVDYSICSNGGMGIIYSGSESNIFSKIYPYQNNKRNTEAYAPTRTPDLIIVNLHTNDNWQWFSNTPENRNGENEKYNYATFDAAFDNMIKTFTDLYGKDVPMLFVFGCMANEQYENATVRSKELIKLKYIPDGYDIEIVTLTTDRSGSSSHPALAGAAIQGAELAEFIRNTYTDLFD